MANNDIAARLTIDVAVVVDYSRIADKDLEVWAPISLLHTIDPTRAVKAAIEQVIRDAQIHIADNPPHAD